MGHRRARVEVSRVWKGPAAVEFVVLTTDDAACGLDLHRGEEWLFYAGGDVGAGYTVQLCDRSTRTVDAEAAVLGEPRHTREMPPLVPTPLERALAERDVDAVRAAIAGGADGNLPVEGGWPLQLAVTACSVEIVGVLRDAGARAGLNHTPEHALVCPNGAAVRALDADRDLWWGQLAREAAAGHRGQVTSLLDAGVDPNRVSRHQGSALGRALAGGHAEVAALLCARGAVFDPQALATASGDLAVRPWMIVADLTPDDAQVLLATGSEQVGPLLDPGDVVAVAGCEGEIWRTVDRGAVPVVRTSAGYRLLDDDEAFAECPLR